MCVIIPIYCGRKYDQAVAEEEDKKEEEEEKKKKEVTG